MLVEAALATTIFGLCLAATTFAALALVVLALEAVDWATLALAVVATLADVPDLATAAAGAASTNAGVKASRAEKNTVFIKNLSRKISSGMSG